MRIAPVGEADSRPVIHVTFNDGVGGNGTILDVALVRVSVDDDMSLRRGVPVNHIVRNAVQWISGPVILPEVRMKTTVSDFADNGRRVGSDRRLRDVLVPRIICGKKVRAEERS